MRMVVVTLAAAAVAGLAFTADAAPSSKKKQRHVAGKEKTLAQRNTMPRSEEFGYDSTPDHYPVGSIAWWRAMDRNGRGGCCGTPN